MRPRLPDPALGGLSPFFCRTLFGLQSIRAGLGPGVAGGSLLLPPLGGTCDAGMPLFLENPFVFSWMMQGVYDLWTRNAAHFFLCPFRGIRVFLLDIWG